MKVVTPLSAIVRETNASRCITPARVLVLYRTGDSYGQQVAEYYRAARGIPAGNIVPCAFTWSPTTETITDAAFRPVLETIAPLLIEKDILAIVTCGWWPNRASDGPLHTISNQLSYPHMKLAGQDGMSRTKIKLEWLYDYPASYREGPILIRSSALTSPYPYRMLPPVHRYDVEGTLTGYVHFRLEVSPSPSDDHYTRTIRMIDDAITAEAAQFGNVGNVVISGSTVYSVGTYAYIDLLQCNVPYTNCYKSKLITEPTPWMTPYALYTWGYHTWIRPSTANGYIYKVSSYTTGYVGTVEPVWPTTLGVTVDDDGITWKCAYSLADSLPAGDTALTPGYGTFTAANYTDVFLHFVGSEAYYGSAIEPQQLTDFTYRQGAIAGWGMSYSAIPIAVAGIDWDAGTRTLGNVTAVNAKNTNAGIPCANENGISRNRLFCKYSGAAAAATITVSSNTLTFLEDAVPVGSVALSGTLRNMVSQITAALPASWTTGALNGGAESRTQQSIKAGACIAIGSSVEPYTDGAFKTANIVSSLWLGEAIGETAFKLGMPMFSGNMSTFDGVTIYGDPLYRPFGHRL